MNIPAFINPLFPAGFHHQVAPASTTPGVTNPVVTKPASDTWGLARWVMGAVLLINTQFATAADSQPVSLGTINQAELIGIIKGAQITIDDQAKGRCWTNLKTTTARAVRQLHKDDIVVYPGPILPSAYSATIELTVIAERDPATKLCYGSRSIRIWAHNFGEYHLQNGDTASAINRIPVYERSGILLTEFNFNKLMLKFIDESLGGFNDIRAGVRQSSALVQRINKDYPTDKVLLSWEEFDSFRDAPIDTDIKRRFNADAVYLRHLEQNRL